MSEQTFIEIELDQLMGLALEQKAAGGRFVQCNAMRGSEGVLDLMYSFSDDERLTLTNYLLHVPAPTLPAPEAATGRMPEPAEPTDPAVQADDGAITETGGHAAKKSDEPADDVNPEPASGPVVPSLGSLFPNAFMFENEMHDLFAVNVEGMSIDFHGGFYHLHIPMPMAAEPEKPARKAPAKPAGR